MAHPLAEERQEHEAAHGLPHATTDTDRYLVAIHHQLVGLRADLAAVLGTQQPDEGEDIELTEPGPPAGNQNRRRNRR